MVQKELTKRQKEFLAMTAQGLMHEKIAEICVVSPETVRNSLARARERMKASTTAQCVVLAIAREELGLTHEGYCYVPNIES